MFSLFRCGRGASFVDNVASGGIISQVDISTGTIFTDGLCGHRSYEVHPDTGIRFKGSQIPDWSALLSIAVEAHRMLPGQRLLGWDYAWSTKGWGVVEVNPSPSFASFQTFTEAGARPLQIKSGLLK